MTQEQTQKKNMSIDDEKPEAWNALKKTRLDFHGNKIISGDVPFEWEWDSEDNNVKETSEYSKFQVQWHDDEDQDDAPNEHPVFGDTNMVDNPPHYNNGGIECIEAIEAMLSKDEYIGYLRGNALKYMWRFRYKSKPFEDLRKARWYEERLMKFLLDNQDAV